LVRQPYVGPGLPQKLLPAEVSGYCFFRLRDKSFFQGGLSAPRPTSKRTPHFTITNINWLMLFKFNPLKTKLV
jgi:hypothetical protein